MIISTIDTGRFKLDGGAMFGVVPKTLWQRTNPADADNRIDMAMRCLLVQHENRLILVDNGIGEQHDEKFCKIYALENKGVLDASLAAKGFQRADITDLVLTHLHFDHCGATAIYNEDKGFYEPTFPNANIWVQRAHLDWAMAPNPREKASFLKQNIDPIAQSGQLNLLDGDTELFPGFSLRTVNGHTEAQQLPVLQYKGKTLCYAADLFPTAGHIPLPYVMGYDTRPLLTLQEREQFLPWIVDNEVILIYEHDPVNECGTVEQTPRGGYRSAATFDLKDIL